LDIPNGLWPLAGAAGRGRAYIREAVANEGEGRAYCGAAAQIPQQPAASREPRQDFVAEAGASRKSVGSWELLIGT
jgi:hypothetical protein